MKKTNIMKNILKGASIGAIIASCGSASAYDYVSNSLTPDFATTGGFSPANGATAFDTKTANTIYFNHTATITVNTNNTAVQTLDLVGYNATIDFDINTDESSNPLIILNSWHPTSTGYNVASNISGFSASGATDDSARVSVEFSDVGIGIIQSGLEYISEIDFKNNAATLKIGTTGNDAGTLTLGALGIKSTIGDNGILSFIGSGTILDTTTPEGTANEINDISVADAQTLTISSVALASNITPKNGITLNGAAALTLTGTSGFVTTVSKVVHDANATSTITMDQYSKITTLDAPTNANGQANVIATGGEIETLGTKAGGTVINVTDNELKINAITSTAGILTLNNATDVTVATTVGNGGAVATLNCKGDGLFTSTGDAYITTLNHSGTGGVKFTGNAAIATLTNTGSGILTFEGGGTIATLNPGADNTTSIAVDTTALIITKLAPTTTSTGTVTLNNSILTTITTLGETAARLDSLTLNGSADVNAPNDAYVNTVTNASTAGAFDFKAESSITTYNHTGAGTSKFTGAATIETMTYSGTGVLTFTTGATISKLLTYTSATPLNLGATSSSANIVFGPDATTLTTAVSPTTVVFATNSSGSMVNILTISGVTYAAEDTTITFDSSLPIAGKLSDGYISAPGVGTTYDGVTFTTSNAVTIWTGSKSDANKLYFMPTYNPSTLNAKLAAAGAKGNSANFINKLAGSNPAAGTTAYALLSLISQEAGTNIEKSTEATNKVITSNFGSAASQAATDSSTSVVMSRFAVASAAEGLSSGDSESLSVVSSGAEDKMNIGVWGQILGATATQKSRKSDPGYKQKGAGVTLGVDTEISDYSVVGLSASYLGSNISFKDFMSGDKTKSTNLVMSLYGKTDLPYSTFVRAIATFGSGKVKSSSKRVATATTYDTAHANYNTMSYSIVALYGYKYGMSKDISLVPAVGLRFVEMLDGGYTESGSRFNRTVSKKSSNSLTAVFGMGTEYKTHFDEYTLVTEAHIYGNYVAAAKNPKISASFDGMNSTFDISPSKASKFSTNLGVSGTMKVCHYEYGLTYDAKISDKFLSHQGTLKLKVNL
ncbi:MAG: autotransporter outer membrane beta-barrel domain-containing protein [Alphaproteobacteria bacterium]|nr:autotransporter outer membrane beta-barrel domain-containing protein [Alphaproteobacteria bacterium]